MIVFVNFILSFSQNLGYSGVILLMAIESSFIPFPSEIIIPPAAYLASQGQMNIFLVIISGIAGSLIGATINYWLAFWLGPKIIYRCADSKICKILLINSRKVKRSEKFFLRYGNASTLIGRLIPVIRQLISLPAGFAKMNFKSFVFYTTLGSAVWVIFLAGSGYILGANQELIIKYYEIISLSLVALLIVVGFVWWLINKKD